MTAYNIKRHSVVLLDQARSFQAFFVHETSYDYGLHLWKERLKFSG